MKVRILKENKQAIEKIEESMRDIALAGGLAMGGMLGRTAQGGVEGYDTKTVEVAHAFAKNRVKKTLEKEKSILLYRYDCY